MMGRLSGERERERERESNCSHRESGVRAVGGVRV